MHRAKARRRGRKLVHLGFRPPFGLPQGSPELLSLPSRISETTVVLTELARLCTSLATGILKLQDYGLEVGDFGGDAGMRGLWWVEREGLHEPVSSNVAM